MRVLVFGNPLLKHDSLPLRLLPKLRRRFSNIEFVEADPTDIEFDGELLAIDTVKGIKDVRIIDDIDVFKMGRIHSMHELDFGQTLKLALAAGLLKKVKIICVPYGSSEDKALRAIEKALISIERAESARRRTCTGHRRG